MALRTLRPQATRIPSYVGRHGDGQRGALHEDAEIGGDGDEAGDCRVFWCMFSEVSSSE